MQQFKWSVAVVLAVAGIVISSGTVEAQKTKGKTRPATTKQLMKGFVVTNCGDLGKALKAAETNWDEVALRGALLSEAGYGLLDDGRCPDGDWAKAAKALQSHGKEVVEAAGKKDLDAAKAAFGKLTGEGCAVCHKAHKK